VETNRGFWYGDQLVDFWSKRKKNGDGRSRKEEELLSSAGGRRTKNVVWTKDKKNAALAGISGSPTRSRRRGRC